MTTDLAVAMRPLPDNTTAEVDASPLPDSTVGGIDASRRPRSGAPSGAPSSESSGCSACGSPEAPVRCSRCKSVAYCHKSCQKSHWSVHKRVCAAPTAADADQATWDRVCDQCQEQMLRAIVASNQGDLSKAAMQCQAALCLLEPFHTDGARVLRVIVLHQLFNVQNQADYNSLAPLQRCVDDAQLALDGMSADPRARTSRFLDIVAEHEGKKALLLLRGGAQLSEALRAFKPVITTCSKMDPNKKSELLELIAAFACELQNRGHHEPALRMFKLALKYFERSNGPQDTLVAHALLTCSICLAAMGRYEEAKKMQERGLAIFAHNGDAADVARTNDKIGNRCASQGQLDQAAIHWRRALAFYKKHPDHRLKLLLSKLAHPTLVSEVLRRETEEIQMAETAGCESSAQKQDKKAVRKTTRQLKGLIRSRCAWEGCVQDQPDDLKACARCRLEPHTHTHTHTHTHIHTYTYIYIYIYIYINCIYIHTHTHTHTHTHMYHSVWDSGSLPNLTHFSPPPRFVYYCSRECQKAAWPGHKNTCSKTQSSQA